MRGRLHWLAMKFYPRRWQAVIVCLLLGIAMGAAAAAIKAVIDANNRQDRADTAQRKLIRQNRRLIAQNAAFTRRLARLEHPTKADLRRLIRSFIGGLTPLQARVVVERAGIGSQGTTGSPQTGRGPTAGTNPPRPGSRPQNPAPIPRPTPPSRPRPPAVPRPPGPPSVPPSLEPFLCPLIGPLLPQLC